MTVPMMDLRTQMAALKAEIEPEIQDILASGQFVLGARLRAFEEEAAAFLDAEQAIGVASGTDALHLALRAMGIGPGDEVITTPFTFAATAEAICHVGARPVFADVDSLTYNLDPESVEAVVTPATKAILPVHLFGQPVAMEDLGFLAERYGLTILEDGAQSFGASRQGRVSGTWGLAGAFSFFPSKNLGGVGDGGLVTTRSETVAERLFQLRNHGSDRAHHHQEPGYNSRLDEIQAAVLRIKLRYIRAYNEGRRRVAGAYRRNLAKAAVRLPYEAEEGSHIYHQFVIRANNRDEIRDALTRAHIGSAIYYPIPLHRQPAFAPYAEEAYCPVADRLAEQVLALPIYPELSKEGVECVAAVVEEVARP